MRDACDVVEAVGVEFKNLIVKKICEHTLKPYETLF